MYGKIFITMWEGSLMMQGGRDAVGLFAYMCAAADQDGLVTLSKGILGQRAGFNPHDPDDWLKFEAALEILEAPDENSNIMEHNGRRIIPLKDLPEYPENRGWWIVNYKHYLYKSSPGEKKAKAALRQRRKYWRDKLTAEGKNLTEIEAYISKLEAETEETSRIPHTNLTPPNATSRYIDIDKDIDTNSVGNTELVNGEKPQKVIKIHKTCEKCFKPFEPQYPGHTLCLDCFKKSKAHPTANLPKCPNPKCTIQTPNQRIDLKVGGCNFCKPEEVD